jgi:CheY-like chemotaxis protein
MLKKGRVYHLILMDIHMPQCDGYSSTEKIRNMEKTEKVTIKNHIVAISADENDLTVSFSKEGGMNDFIQKPISQPILYNVLKERTGDLKIQDLLIIH